MRIKIFSTFILATFFCSGQQNKDLLEQYRSYPDDTAKVSLLYEKGFSYRNTDLPSAIRFVKECYAAALKVNNTSYTAKALNLLGVLKSETGLHKEALLDFEKALQLRIQTADTLSQAIILNNMGNVYGLMTHHTKALAFYEKSLQTARSIGNDRWTQGALFSMVEMQTELEMYEQAEGNLYTLISWAQNKNDAEILGMCYKNMSLCKLGLADTAAAEAYQVQALDISELTGDDILKADVLTFLGNIQALKKNYAEALKNLQEALAISLRNKYSEGLIRVWKKLADHYHATGRDQEAYTYLAKHDSAMALLKTLPVDSLAGLWKEKNESPVTLKKEPFSFKDHIFESFIFAALLLLLIFVLSKRQHEQKEAEK